MFLDSDEEIGGADGMEKFVHCQDFRDLNIGFALDEGMASKGDHFILFPGERSIWRKYYFLIDFTLLYSNIFNASSLKRLVGANKPTSVKVVSPLSCFVFHDVTSNIYHVNQSACFVQ